MKMLFYFLGLMLLFSCEKIEPIPQLDPTPIDTTYVLKWNTKIGNHDYSSDWSYIHKNELIVGSKDLDSASSSKLIGFDKFTGTKLWDYEFAKEKGGWRGFANMVQKDNILVISTLTALFSFDLDSKSILWSKVHDDTGEDGFRSLNIIDDCVYTCLSIGIYATIGYQNKLVRFNIHNGQRENIYQYIHPNGWSVSYSQPAQYIDPKSGDTILLFKRYYSSPKDGPKMPSDLCAYNLTKKEVMWEKIAFSPLSSSKFYPSNILGDDALVVSDNSVYKYDIMSGELLWKTTLGSNPGTWLGYFRMAEPTLFNSRLYLQENLDGFYCIDAVSGDLIWTNPKGSSSPGQNMIIHKDMIINNGKGRVRGYDLQSGLTFMSVKAPNGNIPENGIAYDMETNTYFSADFHSAFAFKVNKPK
jgi:outer membrane protein assembly factor BamB